MWCCVTAESLAEVVDAYSEQIVEVDAFLLDSGAQREDKADGFTELSTDLSEELIAIAEEEEEEEVQATPLAAGQFVVTLHKTRPQSTLGIVTVVRESPVTLKVDAIDGSFVAAWSADSPLSSNQQIRPGDHVISVNGENTEVDRVFSIIEECNTLTLLIQRTHQ